MNRVRATCIHLLISLFVLIALLFIIFFFWFPQDLIYAGGIDGLKIITGVDLILGPLLTFIVFVPNKKGLRFDLSLIATLQIACLAYGMWLVYSQRPMVQVLIDDGIHLLSAYDLKQNNVSVNKFSGAYPKHVFMELPKDKSKWSAVKFATELTEGKPFSLRSDLYISAHNIKLEKYNMRINTILSVLNNKTLNRLNNSKDQSCTWVPIISSHTKNYACISKMNGIEKLSDKKIFQF